MTVVLSLLQCCLDVTMKYVYFALQQIFLSSVFTSATTMDWQHSLSLEECCLFSLDSLQKEGI